MTKQVWEKLEPLTKDGRLTLRIVPLALSRIDNVMVIAQILGSDNPSAEWVKAESGQLENLPETPAPKGALGMKANVEFAQSLNLREIPFFVYKNTDGKLRAVRGLPQDWNKLLAEMGISP
jgi:hypothetical protein